MKGEDRGHEEREMMFFKMKVHSVSDCLRKQQKREAVKTRTPTRTTKESSQGMDPRISDGDGQEEDPSTSERRCLGESLSA